MANTEEPRKGHIWRCLDCQCSLRSETLGLRCTGCGKHYPEIAGVSILVSDPIGYLRSEIASLMRSSQDAQKRKDRLDRIERDGRVLPSVSLTRHRDVIDAEIARANMFLTLVEPVAKRLEASTNGADEPSDEKRLSIRRSGWASDALFPYLLRDWTNTSEAGALESVIGAALEEVFPDASAKSIVLAGCGAGGLLAGISPKFDRVLGFDLNLPILQAVRHLLDGNSLDVALPRCMNKLGRVSLRGRDAASDSPQIALLAMDAFDTAFVDGSIDCVITSFLLDLIPSPRKLADEIHRILCSNGIWINYGPSGPVNAFWRFDQVESVAFFESAGFTVVRADASRSTYLDLSRDCPSWSFQNHMCYLISARKTRPIGEQPVTAKPFPTELLQIVPQHLPAANLIHRQSLGKEQTRTILLRHERTPGRMESLEIDGHVARIMALVDGKRTVREIADMLNQEMPGEPVDGIIREFERFFKQGLLTWRDG
jgi:SAM-dependent methyltransferase